jgi:hypothetical protein
MENKNKKRILIGILIVLILMNLAALGMFGYKKYCGHHRPDRKWMDNNDFKRDPQERVKQFVKNELELNDDQFAKYCALKDTNIKLSNEIWNHISKLREASNLELSSLNPDTVKLNQLADSLGFYHKKMILDMNHHFLSVKKILNPTQLEKYNNMLRNIEKGRFKNRGGKGPMNDKWDNRK